MGQSRFESLSQELPSVLQSLEDKRRELKSQGHKAGLWGRSGRKKFRSLFLYLEK